ncbi:MAG: hypothetical protein IJT81_06050 [Lachnospiraceae bacterium]|nr:hypothetical protein [Lachnospiraceae bacterium]
MKKRILSLILVMAMVVSAFMAPTKSDAKGTEKRFFIGAMGMRPMRNYYGNNSIEEIAQNSGIFMYEASEQDFPTKFDLREHGLSTSVKNQGNYGTCWCFSAVSSLESNALMMGLAGPDIDISEYHLGYFSTHVLEGQDPSIEGDGADMGKRWYDLGGDLNFVETTLMKGYGPASEEQFPYKNIKKDLTIEDATNYNLMSFNACYWLRGDDINSIKEALTRNGAVEANVCATSWEDNKYFNEKTFAAYIPKATENYPSIDHGVSIVGWDDDFSKENFSTKPEKDGAWIVKNSWGDGWGDNGYFYISYYDAIMTAYPMISYTLSPVNASDYIYQYDGAPGYPYAYGTSAVAIAITAKEDETLTMIAINPYKTYDFENNCWKTFEPVDATINVLTDVADEKLIHEGKSIYSQRIHIENYGYQKFEFDKGVNLDKGKKYWITVTFDEEVFYCAGYYEDWGDGQCLYSVNNPGESFAYFEGDNWMDIFDADDGAHADLCIKVFVRNGHDMPVIHRLPTLEEPTFYLLNNEEAKVTVTWKTVEGAEGYNIYRKVKGVEADFSLLATVDAATTKYADTGLTIGQDYIYKVVPFAGSIEGNSAEKTIRATIAAPWITKLENTKKGQVKITIQKVNGAKSYSAYRLIGKTYQYLGNTTKTTYVDTFKKGSYEKGVTYTYKLAVKRGDRTSALSAAKTITTNK